MKKILSLLLCCFLIASLTACEKMDPNYGKSSAQKENVVSTNETKETISIPEIKSDDSVMPNYIDISLYDEENYADIYLGKDFKYNITYSGSILEVPSSYKDMVKKGWTLMPSDEYNEDSQILVGKSLEVIFLNQYNKQITAVFYNNKKTSTALKKCPIVKFKICENVLVNSDSFYGQFWVNGISNELVITDIIECLGYPSHFYCIGENKYYLDWFVSQADRRSGITVYIDTAEDRIEAIEISYY